MEIRTFEKFVKSDLPVQVPARFSSLKNMESPVEMPGILHSEKVSNDLDSAVKGPFLVPVESGKIKAV